MKLLKELRFTTILLIITLAGLMIYAVARAEPAIAEGETQVEGGIMLKVGDPAPDFDLSATDGSTVKLSAQLGKTVVLYFYPKDNTPGCTKEACNIRDNWSEFLKRGWLVFGISADSLKSHQKFTTDFSLPFPLLSDPDRTVQKAYGAFGKKKLMGREYEGTLRYTYVIGPDGKLLHITRDVKVNEHSQQLFDAVPVK